MKNSITTILLLISMTVFSQSMQDTTWNARLNKVENRLNEIDKKNYESEISILKDKLDFQQKISEQTISCVSNQLDSASYSLTLFGILFAVAAIGIGLYVTYIERKIVKIGEENKALLTKNQKIKEDVEALNKLIQSDIYNLFLKIKREESVYILERLVKVPKDIANVCETLLSRELQQEDFTKLRQAYLNLTDSKGGDYGHYYLILFFQHFLGQALRDEKLRADISEFIPSGINSSFENDIAKSTLDFTIILIDKGILEFKSELNQFFSGLTNSQYKDYQPVYQLLFENLKSRKNRFDLFSAVESTTEKRLAKIEYGKLLLNKYSNEDLSETEQLIFTELSELIKEQKKADDEAKRLEDEKKKKQEERQKQHEEQKNKQKDKR